MTADAVAQEARMEGGEDLQGVSIVQFFNVLLRRRWLVAGIPVALAFLVCLFTLLQPRTYTSAASITPQSENVQTGRLAGLAAQFGLSLPRGGAASQSPEFYADLIESRTILTQLARTEYMVPEEVSGETQLRRNLLDLYEIEADSEPLRIEMALERLGDDVDVTVNVETGVVGVTVRSPWPGLSQRMARRLIDLVNRFNLQTRQSQAAEERRFLADRVDSARVDLRQAEEELRRFLEQNRAYQNSPQLQFEHDRLQRRVTLQQQVYTSLVESLEQAKIEEVRDTPVITVVEEPYDPARPDRRYLLAKGVLSLLLGTLIAGFIAFVLEGWDRLRRVEPRSIREFRRLLSDLVQEIRAVWRRLPGSRKTTS